MIENKLVERDVEVQKVVTEKRTLQVYLYKDTEYLSKDDLQKRIQMELCASLMNLVNFLRSTTYVTKYQKVDTLLCAISTGRGFQSSEGITAILNTIKHWIKYIDDEVKDLLVLGEKE